LKSLSLFAAAACIYRYAALHTLQRYFMLPKHNKMLRHQFTNLHAEIAKVRVGR
jgi:hypothetical protein